MYNHIVMKTPQLMTSWVGCRLPDTCNYLVKTLQRIRVKIKVACTSGPIFEKKYEALPHIFCVYD